MADRKVPVLLRVYRLVKLADMPARMWAYRDVMTRPWPSVEPLTDDAWDD